MSTPNKSVRSTFKEEEGFNEAARRGEHKRRVGEELMMGMEERRGIG